MSEDGMIVQQLDPDQDHLPSFDWTFGDIFQNTLEGIVLIDEGCRIVAWNSAQERIAGVPRDQVLGEPMYDVIFRFLPPEKRSTEHYMQLKRWLEAYMHDERSPRMNSVIEHEIVRPDGTRRVIQNGYFLVETHRGRLAGSIVRDVTAQRREVKAEREAIQLREEFILSISHGLRDPLHSLQGILESLSARSVPDPELQRKLLDRACEDVQRIASMVDDLIDTAELETGEIELDMTRVDIRSVIDGVVASLSQVAKDRGIRVAYAPAHRDRAVRANARRLRQVVSSLLENAIRISPSGSPVLVTSHAQNGEMMVQVIDQGPGIPSEVESALFERHYPKDGMGELAQGRTGLGLYLSKRIIAAHGGRIGVRSQLGVGSTFYFAIPAERD